MQEQSTNRSKRLKKLLDDQSLIDRKEDRSIDEIDRLGDKPTNSESIDIIEHDQSSIDRIDIESFELIPPFNQSKLFEKWLNKYTRDQKLIPDELIIKSISKPIVFLQIKKEINLAMLYIAAYLCSSTNAKVVDYKDVLSKIKALFYSDINKRLEDHWISTDEIDQYSDHLLVFPSIDRSMQSVIQSIDRYFVPYTIDRSDIAMQTAAGIPSIDQIRAIGIDFSRYHIYFEFEDRVIEDYSTAIYQDYVARNSIIRLIDQPNDQLNDLVYWVAWGRRGGKIFSRSHYANNPIRSKIIDNQSDDSIRFDDILVNTINQEYDKFPTTQIIAGDISALYPIFRTIIEIRGIQRSMKIVPGPTIYFDFSDTDRSIYQALRSIYPGINKSEYEKITRSLGIISIDVDRSTIDRLDDLIIFLNYKMCNIPQGSVLVFSIFSDLVRKEYINRYADLSVDEYHDLIAVELYQEIVSEFDDQEKMEKFIASELAAQLDESEYEKLGESYKSAIYRSIVRKWETKKSNAIDIYQNKISQLVDQYEDNIRNKNYEFFRSEYSKESQIKIFKTLNSIDQFTERHQSFAYIPLQLAGQFKIDNRLIEEISDQSIDQIPGSAEYIKIVNEKISDQSNDRFDLLTDALFLKILHASNKLHGNRALMYAQIDQAYSYIFVRGSNQSWIKSKSEINILKEQIQYLGGINR
jgi:hypothetical protein